ncbi:hypothetical protein GH714_017507 [Hevea brasiliensis]|uniref:Uncharacterized protein n=1 Tax=Hevea brasiliensis TaxID=3981 RepID=A0A6A6KW20_HEVBR|nr:hypothetical protein GH714_017507 [Hevea brasiliensis]
MDSLGLQASRFQELGQQQSGQDVSHKRREVTILVQPEYQIGLKNRSFSSDSGDLVMLLSLSCESITDGTLAKFLKSMSL